MQHVFDPATRARADGKPRVLITNGFGPYDSLEVMTFCFENNITLCRLPSHTSHKLQPCNVGVFGPLKAAYREQVEHLFRGGAETVGRQHFTLLYNRARECALTERNICSSWSRAGLYPLNPDRVLREMPLPALEENVGIVATYSLQSCLVSPAVPRTPLTPRSLNTLRNKLDDCSRNFDDKSRFMIEKAINAAEKALADKALIDDEKQRLREQNNEKKARSTVKSTVVGKAKIMTYEDIVEAQEKHDERQASKSSSKAGTRNSKPPQSPASLRKHSLVQEEKNANHEIAVVGLSVFCSILRFE